MHITTQQELVAYIEYIKKMVENKEKYGSKTENLKKIMASLQEQLHEMTIQSA